MRSVLRHRKKSVSAPWDGKSHFAPESARQAPPRGISSAEVSLCGASRGLSARPLHPFGEPTYPQGKGMRQRARWGLSSGQKIGAVRTAVRSACCLPELRVANRLRRLYPLDTRFPPFPPAPLRIAIRSNSAPHKPASPSPAPKSVRPSPA